MTRVGEFSLLRLVGVELEEVGDDFGFGRVGREAVGGNALAARCTSGAGRPVVGPYRRRAQKAPRGGIDKSRRICYHSAIFNREIGDIEQKIA